MSSMLPLGLCGNSPLVGEPSGWAYIRATCSLSHSACLIESSAGGAPGWGYNRGPLFFIPWPRLDGVRGGANFPPPMGGGQPVVPTPRRQAAFAAPAGKAHPPINEFPAIIIREGAGLPFPPRHR